MGKKSECSKQHCMNLPVWSQCSASYENPWILFLTYENPLFDLRSDRLYKELNRSQPHTRGGMVVCYLVEDAFSNHTNIRISWWWIHHCRLIMRSTFTQYKCHFRQKACVCFAFAFKTTWNFMFMYASSSRLLYVQFDFQRRCIQIFFITIQTNIMNI